MVLKNLFRAFFLKFWGKVCAAAAATFVFQQDS